MFRTHNQTTIRWSLTAAGVLFLFQIAFLGFLGARTADAYEIQGVKVDKQTTILGRASSYDHVGAPIAPFQGSHEREAAGTAFVVETDPLYISELNYASAIQQTIGRDSIVVNSTLSSRENRATLDLLADRVWRDNGGENFKTMTINWQVGANPGVASPWARTVIYRR